jgi:hypothetical protein
MTKTHSKLGYKRNRMKDVEFFVAIDKENINVVCQRIIRQKITIESKKSIVGVAQRHLKKGDGFMVTFSNSIVEQKNDETSIPSFMSLYEGK